MGEHSQETGGDSCWFLEKERLTAGPVLPPAGRHNLWTSRHTEPQPGQARGRDVLSCSHLDVLHLQNRNLDLAKLSPNASFHLQRVTLWFEELFV